MSGKYKLELPRITRNLTMKLLLDSCLKLWIHLQAYHTSFALYVAFNITLVNCRQSLIRHGKNPEDFRYSKQHYGHNTLDHFMQKLCKDMNLSQYYTNHCILVTGITNLTRTNFTAKQIMSISRHKSVESLAIDQKVVSNEK